MPSKAPPTRSAWWAVIIPLVLVAASVAWAFSSFGSKPEGVPQRGVRTTAPKPAGTPPARQEPQALEPETVPEPPRPPSPEPGPEGTRLEESSTEPRVPTEADIPEWKWDIARRRVMITMYATQWCDVCARAREYLKTNRIEFSEIDTDENPAASVRLGELNPQKTIPTFQIDELVYVGFREDLFEAKLNQAARKHL